MMDVWCELREIACKCYRTTHSSSVSRLEAAEHLVAKCWRSPLEDPTISRLGL